MAKVTFTRDELAALAKRTSNYQTVDLTVFKARNVGSSDIAGQSFSLPDEYIWAFGSVTNPNGNPKNVAMEHGSKVLSVKYRLLPPKSEHVFWAASLGDLTYREFSNDAPGVHVVTDDEKREAERPFPWGWLGAAGLAFVGLVLGLAFGEQAVADRLKRHGHNLKTLLAPPDPPAS